MPGFRYVTWSEYGELAEALARRVGSANEKFDLVIGLARGGIPVSMVVSDRLGLDLDFMTVKSYHGIAKRATPKILPTLTEEIRGKRILVVDDLVDEGDTLASVLHHLRESEPRGLKTAVVFKKPWSKTEPDYFVETTDQWIVFPFELNEVETLRKVRDGEKSSAEK